MNRKYKNEEMIYFLDVFKKYEDKFGENLFCAWDYLSVDWLGMAKAAEEAMKIGVPLTIDQINKLQGYEDDGKFYVL